MPLSDREQEILHEIERDLLADDPDLGKAERATSSGSRRVKGGVAIFVLGLLLLAAFFATSGIVIGLAAFGAMVGGVVLFVGGLRDVIPPGGTELGGRRIADLLGGSDPRDKNGHRNP